MSCIRSEHCSPSAAGSDGDDGSRTCELDGVASHDTFDGPCDQRPFGVEITLDSYDSAIFTRSSSASS